MNNLMIKSAISLLVGISVVAFIALAHFNNLDLSRVENLLELSPKVISIDALVVTVFTKWGWKLKLFRGWLVPFPNLSGSWLGHIHSDWKNPKTDLKPPPIPIMLTVNQSFFKISCIMRTSEMKSSSYSEGFLIDDDRQIKSIAYSYISKPRLSLSDRSMAHDGTAVFEIIEKPKKKIVGRYWTERLTKGEIVLEHYSTKLVEEMPESLGEHPVTENENLR